MPFYSIYIPSISSADDQLDANSAARASYVFLKKSQALDYLKQYKDARLREFNNEDDAIQYSQTGYEVITTRYADSKTPTATGEKAIFRAPSKQELTEFRKIIEAGDYERVKNIVWDNPRYLVSSGDTPTTLKEGYRYNAMHVCAISKQPRIAELILRTVSDPKFVDLLTGKKNEEKMCKELCANLLDYYLNIPEKGRSETPLHFASKYVCVEMVEVLTSYPEIKMTYNKENQLPQHIIGSRNAQAAPEDLKRIKSLLEERFYVPVLRTMDGSMPPQIGQYFSANNPPNLNCDPLSPEVKIQALAGPMNMDQAKEFRRRWKTPPRIGSNVASPIANNPYISPMKPRFAVGAFTPTKLSTTQHQQPEHTTTHTANRVLFQKTPKSASTSSAEIDGAEEPIPTLEINGEKLANSLTQITNENENANENELNVNNITEIDADSTQNIDQQNGNHGNINEADANVLYSEVSETETVLDVKMEANNNHAEQPIITVKTKEMHITQTALYPSTPLMKLKKNAFFTYRDHYASSPIDFSVLHTDGGSVAHDLDDALETPMRNVQRKAEQPIITVKTKTALCPSTPLMKLKKNAFFTYRDGYASSPIDFSVLRTDGGSVAHDLDDALETPIRNELHGGTDVANVSLLAERSICDTPGFKERHIKISDTEKGLEIIGRELAKEQHVEWREYWDFLDAFIDIAAPVGLQKLEHYFTQRLHAEEVAKRASQVRNDVMLADVCSVLDKFVFAGGGGAGGDSGLNAGTADASRNGYSEYARFTGGGGSGMSAADAVASTASAGTNTATTPYTCVEKSLQVFAKRMTKTIIHNIDNVVSINDTLMSELKRLKSLICSFKEDVRFLDVNFTKVHSRIGNLVSIYLENTQESSVKSKIQTIVQNLLTATSERREHIECVCSRIHYNLTHPAEQIQPENLKTETMCAKVWHEEKDCDCQWETNLSRKVSRRHRMESRYKNNIQQFMQTEHTPQNANENDWPQLSDDIDDDVFWSDFEASDTEDEEDDVWMTPPQSPIDSTPLESAEEDEGYKTYIYGSEPTKRDLDVLNAIFHVDIDKQKYPNVYAWRETLMRYPNEEMDFFPSPSVIRKSSKSLSMKSNQQSITQSDIPHTPPLHRRNTPHGRMATAAGTALHPSPNRRAEGTLPTAKRLFASPTATAAIIAARQRINANQLRISNNTQPPPPPAPAPVMMTTANSEAQTQATAPRNQMFMSPLNRLRGLFYRGERSPLSSASSASPAAYMGDRSGSDGSNNLSLLNISAAD